MQLTAVLVAGLVAVAVTSTDPPLPTCSGDIKFMVTTCAAEVQQSILYPRLQLPDRICRGVVCWPFLHRQRIPCVDPMHALYERVRFLCPDKDDTSSNKPPSASSIPPTTAPPIATPRSASRTPGGESSESPTVLNATSADAANTTFDFVSSHVRTGWPSAFDSHDAAAAGSAFGHNVTNDTIAGQRTTMGDFVTTPPPHASSAVEGDEETTVRSSPRSAQSSGAAPVAASVFLAAAIHLASF